MTPLADQVQAHFQHGVALFQQGRYDEALQHLQYALHLHPHHVDALTWLANVFVYQQRYDEAIFHYRQALRLNPDIFGAHYVLGVALYDKGQFGEAEVHYRHALRLNPGHAEAHQGLGAVMMAQGRLDEAALSFHQALQLNPELADAYGNLGILRHRQGRTAEAISHCQQAIQLNPQRAEAHFNLGTVLEAQKERDAAIRCYEQAVQLNPNYVEAFFNLANILDRQEKLSEAVGYYQHVLRLKPDHAEAQNNLGAALAHLKRLDEALVHYREALRLKPEYAEAHAGLGIVYQESGLLHESLACMEHAVRIQPSLAVARWNRALLRLVFGDFEGGWPEYEWRWVQYDVARRHFPQPLWDGSNLHGRTIVLYTEQGFGDAMQFIRYAALVKQRGGKVVVECYPVLMSLLKSMPEIDQLVAVGEELPSCDVQAPLLSLPLILHTTLATIPAKGPYLRADAALVKHWQQKLAVGNPKPFRVGIVWQGNPKHGFDDQRSVRLVDFAALAGVKGVQLFSFQVGPGSEQLATHQGFNVADLGKDFDTSSFADAAAAIMNMDLVITVDTAAAHLAGALGVPVWVMLATFPDWRWLLEREDSPWYPNMRLFRQARRDGWDDVFRRMAEVLKGMLS